MELVIGSRQSQVYRLRRISLEVLTLSVGGLRTLKNVSWFSCVMLAPFFSYVRSAILTDERFVHFQLRRDKRSKLSRGLE